LLLGLSPWHGVFVDAAVMAALSALGRSSERLRDYMGKAAVEVGLLSNYLPELP
jgi:hypothetical protein